MPSPTQPRAPLPLDGFPRFPPRTLDEILGGGQAFRWKRIQYLDTNFATGWTGIWGRNQIDLFSTSGGHLHAEFKFGDGIAALREYLGLNTDYDAIVDALPARSDPFLAAALESFPGLRILRQPPAETLLAFLLSSTKSIPQISNLCETLASRFGEPINDQNHALPDWETLATVPETELRAIGCGFRARYITESARIIANRDLVLADLTQLPTPELRQQLCTLPGVGQKIADCVALFGFGRLEAFPIDTWIARALRSGYGLSDWPLRYLQQFAKAHFGPAAGLAQQYLFAHIRTSPKQSTKENLKTPPAGP